MKAINISSPFTHDSSGCGGQALWEFIETKESLPRRPSADGFVGDNLLMLKRKKIYWINFYI
ncbi:hypothetical protein ACFLS9_03430 [Bacteroidota bacterium]